MIDETIAMRCMLHQRTQPDFDREAVEQARRVHRIPPSEDSVTPECDDLT